MPTASELLQGLEKVPTSNRQLLADYIELRCAISVDGEISLADTMSDAKRQKKDLGSPGAAGPRALGRAMSGREGKFPFGPPAESGPEPGPGDQRDREQLAALGPDDDPPDAPPPLRWDEDPASYGEAWQVIQRRAKAFGGDYPFRIEPTRSLKLRKRRPTDGQRLYLFLLLASCYSNIRRDSDRKKLTSAFERVCVEVLRQYFGARLEAFVFGTAKKKKDRFGGGKKKAIRKLSRHTRLSLTNDWRESYQDLSDSGDHGLDVVGWIPFDHSDRADRRFLVFGQCATGKNWETKQFSVHPDWWGAVFQKAAIISSALFISFSWRDASGAWLIPVKLGTRNVLFDRERIVHLMAGRQTDEVPDRAVQRFLGVADAEV